MTFATHKFLKSDLVSMELRDLFVELIKMRFDFPILFFMKNSTVCSFWIDFIKVYLNTNSLYAFLYIITFFYQF